jgi:hypothetical protein
MKYDDLSVFLLFYFLFTCHINFGGSLMGVGSCRCSFASYVGLADWS